MTVVVGIVSVSVKTVVLKTVLTLLKVEFCCSDTVVDVAEVSPVDRETLVESDTPVPVLMGAVIEPVVGEVPYGGTVSSRGLSPLGIWSR